MCPQCQCSHKRLYKKGCTVYMRIDYWCASIRTAPLHFTNFTSLLALKETVLPHPTLSRWSYQLNRNTVRLLLAFPVTQLLLFLLFFLFIMTLLQRWQCPKFFLSPPIVYCNYCTVIASRNWMLFFILCSPTESFSVRTPVLQEVSFQAKTRTLYL